MPPLLSLPYLPALSWCAAVWSAEKVVVEAHEHYQKGSLRNRCHIAGPNGVQRLSIPLLKGKHQQTPVREVRISRDGNWQRQHWRSICTAYGNAPFFDYYADELAPFYERPYEFLFDYNLDLLTFIFQKKMGWRGTFAFSESWSPPGEWPHGRDLRDAMPGVSGEWPEWFHPHPYPQVFAERFGFLPNLSVLDLLFCCGKQAGEVLEHCQNHSKET